MEAGVSDHVWDLEEITALAPIEAPKKKRGFTINGKLQTEPLPTVLPASDLHVKP